MLQGSLRGACIHWRPAIFKGHLLSLLLEGLENPGVFQKISQTLLLDNADGCVCKLYPAGPLATYCTPLLPIILLPRRASSALWLWLLTLAIRVRSGRLEIVVSLLAIGINLRM